jgi:hypothetical protein
VEQSATHTGLETFHSPVVRLVIMAKQMQQTVNRQNRKLMLQRMSALARLARRRLDADDDVAQLVASVRDESENVRGARRSSETAVEIFEKPIAAEDERHLPASHAQQGRGPHERRGNPARRDPATTLPIENRDSKPGAGSPATDHARFGLSASRLRRARRIHMP